MSLGSCWCRALLGRTAEAIPRRRAGQDTPEAAGAGLPTVTEAGTEVTEAAPGVGRAPVGSGLDLSTISLTNFNLSPGAGGKPELKSGSYSSGGGGGILVDGHGPHGSVYAGEGYGGGGYFDNSHHGPGLILMEIKKNQS